MPHSLLSRAHFFRNVENPPITYLSPRTTTISRQTFCHAGSDRPPRAAAPPPARRNTPPSPIRARGPGTERRATPRVLAPTLEPDRPTPFPRTGSRPVAPCQARCRHRRAQRFRGRLSAVSYSASWSSWATDPRGDARSPRTPKPYLSRYATSMASNPSSLNHSTTSSGVCRFW
jgi:hypothetical protein